MLALGLAYGIGKPMIILQQQHDTPLGEMNNSGYVQYACAIELKTSLESLLTHLLSLTSTQS